ncbi:MAG: C40 family peptidase [Candidatus Marinimicrobia bacterium]|nr:C40 family peptidase [Candidatus Neomarinimicrobiota bacterium]
MPDKLTISQAVAPIYKEPTFTSQMVTQGLLWEIITVLDTNQRWFQVQTEDGYTGWIHEFYTSTSEKPNYNSIQITMRYAPVRENRGRDGTEKQLLSFGTRVPAESLTSGYSYISLHNGEGGFIPPQPPVAKFSRDSLIQIAESLLGVPYLWGGKSSFGYDCSGFVQSIFNHFKVHLARDTSDQIQDERLKKIKSEEAGKGDLIYYFENGNVNHVSIFLDEKDFIHCSGCVRVQSHNKSDPHFHSLLAEMEKQYFSIKELLKN